MVKRAVGIASLYRSIAIVTTIGALALPSGAQAATATGVFDASTDTAKPVNDTAPRGSVTFDDSSGTITGTGQVSGLLANRAYLVVPYADGVCAPTPGVTAFPSAPWTTDANGSATINTTVNPQMINPAGQFTVAQTRSISIREVAAGSQGPGPNVPNPITEACDTAPDLG